MAGDWIKMRTSLLTNPRVTQIARILEDDPKVGRVLTTGFNGALRDIVTRSVTRSVTVASLLVIWGAANEHTKDGVFHHADLSNLDDMTGIPGFGEAMEAVGWAIYDPEEGSVTLPNFAEYNTSGEARSIGAKTAAERQREYRERQKAKAESEAQTSCESVTESDVTRNATRDVTSDVTRNRREEKRREEIEPNGSIPPYPLGLDVEAWEQWVAYRKQIKKPLKPASMAAAQEAMLEFGAGQAEAVRQSIANGWQGLFAPKGAAAAKPVNRQGAVEARNRAVAAEWLASEGVA